MDLQDARTLVLTPRLEPARLSSWQAAITLVVTGKARVVDTYDVAEYGLITTPRQSFGVSAVIQLARPLRHHRKSVKFSRSNMLARDRSRCCYCPPPIAQKPARELTYDHVIPKSRGGKREWGNIVLACHACNLRKKNRTPEEAGMHMHWRPFTPKELSLTQPLIISAGEVHPLWIPYLPVAQATGT